jgi:dihydroxyacetone kinase
MTFLHDDPRTFAADALRGFSQAYGRFVRLAPGGVLRAVAAERKVALVIGGGSGHYPAFAGYVGRGLAHAAVAGDVFASPSTSSIALLARLAHQGAGILLGFGNYAGDVLNFGAAARRLVSEGIDVRILAVTDGVASAPAETPSLRRGVAGDVAVFKAAGAAAEAGLDIDEVERMARLANSRTYSFGVAYRGCTLPGAREPLFVVPAREMAIGLGIHGEPGVSEGPVVTASELAQVLVERLLRERPADASGRVAVILNGLGGTKCEELFGAWGAIERQLERKGLTAVAPEVGEFVTSLDMAGCSLTLTWLDQGLEELWLTPCESAAFRRGPEVSREVLVPIEDAPAPVPTFPAAAAASQLSAGCVARALGRIAEAMHHAESELGDIDAFAGDGDHGLCMSRGSDAASKVATAAAALGEASCSLPGTPARIEREALRALSGGAPCAPGAMLSPTPVRSRRQTLSRAHARRWAR